MFIRTAIDALLELAIVPSFTRIGFAVRSRLFDWQEPPPDALAGRTAVVTGATGGLGRAAATSLAALGAQVVLLGRDPEKLAELRAELTDATGLDRYPTVAADLSSLDDVRRAARDVRAALARSRSGTPAIDVLVDNAGAIFPDRSESPDGHEASMALLAIGPFALVAGLLPQLRASADGRVIAVTSGGQYTQGLDVDDLDGRTIEYGGPQFYARAKRAQVALVREWARRLGPEGPAINAMHPGWAATPGLADSLPGFSEVMGPLLRTAEEGVDTITWLATAPRAEIGSGGLFLDRRRRPFDRAPWTRLSAAERSRLWDEVVRRAGIDPLPSS